MKKSNCADKAIIMAAGIGSRLMPVTASIPKPLIKVNGIRMIDSIIDSLSENGINAIYIVVGYLKEKFEVLRQKYPNVQLIENPYYLTYNNISSLYAVREYLGNCVIIDGDQVVYNKDILKPQFEKSGYCSVWTEKQTDEWLQKVQDGKVVSCSRTGGSFGWRLIGVSFWSEQDGKLLKQLLEIEFEQKHNIDIYWDDIAMFCYPDKFNLGIRMIQEGDIEEIDSYEQLVRIDQSYKEQVPT